MTHEELKQCERNIQELVDDFRQLTGWRVIDIQAPDFRVRTQIKETKIPIKK